MSTTVGISQNVENIEVEITQNDNTIKVYPVISRNGGGGDLSLYMLKSVYDPAEREEQVLTINTVVDGGTITI